MSLLSSSPTYKALIRTAVGKAEVQDVPIPQVRDGWLLVRTKAVALNPTDFKALYGPLANEVGIKMGCDYAGVVEEVGTGVTKFSKGDRVAGLVFGGADMDRGAFGEYVLTPADTTIMNIPDNITFEEAATLGVSLTTVGQGLYQFLKLPLPATPLATPKPILINGGSTATGILGIQFAKLSGLRVLTTASPHNFDYLKSLGADAVYDYHEPVEDLAARIKSDTANALTLAWDCSPTEDSQRLCALSLTSDDALSPTSLYGSLHRPDVAILQAANPGLVGIGGTIAYSAIGPEPFSIYGLKFPGSAEDAAFGRMFWEQVGRGLLARGKIRVARVTVGRGGDGLDGIVAGLEDLKHGRVSGTKLVYTL